MLRPPFLETYHTVLILLGFVFGALWEWGCHRCGASMHSAAAGSKAEKLGVKMDYVAVHTKAIWGTRRGLNGFWEPLHGDRLSVRNLTGLTLVLQVEAASGCDIEIIESVPCRRLTWKCTWRQNRLGQGWRRVRIWSLLIFLLYKVMVVLKGALATISIHKWQQDKHKQKESSRLSQLRAQRLAAQLWRTVGMTCFLAASFPPLDMGLSIKMALRVRTGSHTLRSWRLLNHWTLLHNLAMAAAG